MFSYAIHELRIDLWLSIGMPETLEYGQQS